MIPNAFIEGLTLGFTVWFAALSARWAWYAFIKVISGT